MANYNSQYTGKQIDEAVGKILNGGSGGGTQLYKLDIPITIETEEGSQPVSLSFITHFDPSDFKDMFGIMFLTTSMALIWGLEREGLLVKCNAMAGSIIDDVYFIVELTNYNAETGEYTKEYQNYKSNVETFDYANATVTPL